MPINNIISFGMQPAALFLGPVKHHLRDRTVICCDRNHGDCQPGTTKLPLEKAGVMVPFTVGSGIKTSSVLNINFDPQVFKAIFPENKPF